MTIDVERRILDLGLAPHPEGGHYRRIHASTLEVIHAGHTRPAMTAIDFLLRAGECSRWHRVDADEAWHWQAGGPLWLQMFDADQAQLRRVRLGPAERGDQAMAIVPAGHWQRAWTEAPFAQVACTVSPGFVWEGFALLDAAPQVAQQLEALGAADRP